jgi:hypothetical protein
MQREFRTLFINASEIKSVLAADRRHITASSLSVDWRLATVGKQALRLLPKFLLG